MPNIMNLSVRLTEPLTDYVSNRVGPKGDYDNASEYVRDLIRRDRDHQDQQQFKALKATLQHAFSASDDDAVSMDFETFKSRHSTAVK